MMLCDLVPGMVVKIRLGEFAQVVDLTAGRGLLFNTGKILNLAGYNQDFTRKQDWGGIKDFDIVCVYSLHKYWNRDFKISSQYRDLLWERSTTKKHKEENKMFTKSDLKTGDVIQYRHGDIGITIAEFEMFVLKDGYIKYGSLREDLTDKIGEGDWDVMTVRRPSHNYQIQFNPSASGTGKLVFDRERDTTKEMTMEEVCKALGCNVKIVKEKN